MEIKKGYLVICAILLLFIQFCECVSDEAGSKYTVYTIEIKSLNSFEYEIILPILIEESGNISQVMEDLKITEHGQNKLISTEHGTGLHIIGTENITFSKKIDINVKISWLNMISNETGGGNAIFWIFFNTTTNSSISIYIHGETCLNDKVYLSYINCKLTNTGWSEVPGVKTIKA